MIYDGREKRRRFYSVKRTPPEKKGRHSSTCIGRRRKVDGSSRRGGDPAAAASAVSFSQGHGNVWGKEHGDNVYRPTIANFGVRIFEVGCTYRC